MVNQLTCITAWGNLLLSGLWLGDAVGVGLYLVLGVQSVPVQAFHLVLGVLSPGFALLSLQQDGCWQGQLPEAE